ncbi:MAG: dinucleotide-utilizing protein [Flavobacteriales bacterium]|nr:MAG: dinucleotide-utilizing protein [Flavobacteriales bacterium]
MNLTNQEKNRYSRHILLGKIGLEGQEKLKAAKVLVIGVGGLGCPVLQYLTAAGVGELGIIDYDIIDETNLQRQILFTVNDIGKNKAEVAKNRLKQLNPHINFNVYPEKLTTRNALNLFSEYDIIVDGTDNFSTRYLVNDACVITNKPLIYGAIYKFEGQVTVFNYKGGPTYRCLFPEPPKAGSVPNCSEIGVLGVLPGLIGTQQANEVIKLILGIGKLLSGKLLTYDSLNNSFLTLTINRSEEQVQKVLDEKSNFKDFDYDFFCGIISTFDVNEISLDELRKMFNSSDNFQLVDVRQEWEQPRVEKDNVLIAPLNELESYVTKIATDKKVIVVCQHGIRSIAAIEQLEKEYNFNNLINLQGGIENW